VRLETGVPRQALTGQTWVVQATTLAIGGESGVGIKPDGSVVQFGKYPPGTPPASTNAGVLSVTEGPYHAMAINKDGTLAAWGSNNWGQVSIPEGLSGVVAIATAVTTNLVLKDDGTVAAWGYESAVTDRIPAGLSDVVAISLGNTHALALKADGTVVAWGNGSEAVVPAGLTDVVEIVAGGSMSVARRADGSVVQWGYIHADRPLPQGLTGVRTLGLAYGRYYGLAVLSDTQVIAFGDNSNGPDIGQAPADQANVVSLAMGKYYYNAALHQDGHITVFGKSMVNLDLPAEVPPELRLRVPVR
jgi:alpha-tubulin suppressor-like RCC1 family protein